MIVVYNKNTRKFKIYKDRTAVISTEGLSAEDMLESMERTVETRNLIIGIGEYIKSKRGGKR